MTTTTRRLATLILAALASSTTSVRGQDFTTVRVASRDMRGISVPAPAPAAAAVVHDPNCPFAHAHQAPAVAAQPPAPAAEEVAAPASVAAEVNTYVYQGDPYGFTGIINQIRASAGLHPLAYDPSLAAWASQNNAAQCSRGIGHHINPNCFQNCGWNYSTAYEAATAWMNSPGHRQNMLSPGVTRFGIAYGPGPYWTLNAR
jgi:uncharacterized protein YkwD